MNTFRTIFTKTALTAGLLAGIATLQAPAAHSSDCNTQYCSFPLGAYTVQNDEWGMGSDPSGGQHVYTSGGGWAAGYTWHYTNGSIKAYPSIYAGWQVGGSWSPNHQGFPVKVNANAPLPTSCAWYTNGTQQNYDVAYDMFFSPSTNPTQPSAEMMVWLGYGGQQPAGSKVASAVTLGGVSGTWDVWQGNVGWPVWSFVKTAYTTSFSGHLQPFVYYTAYTKNWLNQGWYVMGTEFGIEVIQGSGEFHCTSFSASAY